MNYTFTKEEVEKLAIKCKKGCEKSKNDLLIALTPLIKSKIYRYFRKFDEDLLQDGFVKILEYLKEYDPQTQDCFFYFCHSKIHNFYRNKLDKNIKKNKRTAIKDEKLSLYLKDEKINFENQCEIFEAMQKIPSRSSFLLLLHIYYGYKLKECAQILGLSLPYIKELKREALLKLKRELE